MTLRATAGRDFTAPVATFTGQPETTNSDVAIQYTYDGDGHVLTQTAVQPAGIPSQTTRYVYGVTGLSLAD